MTPASLLDQQSQRFSAATPSVEDGKLSQLIGRCEYALLMTTELRCSECALTGLWQARSMSAWSSSTRFASSVQCRASGSRRAIRHRWQTSQHGTGAGRLPAKLSFARVKARRSSLGMICRCAGVRSPVVRSRIDIPEIDDAERFLALRFLRRYVTWCARSRRWRFMNGAAHLYRSLGRAR